jgi:2-polyprenyl-3-methyl-5-hydroxy-6-metoxy-1,4-benzoquinol methylase
MSWCAETPAEYDYSYFFDDYKKQYGKTYLEDFAAIKIQCVRRTSYIDSFFWLNQHSSMKRRKYGSVIPAVLDVGCAYGPFLSAAADAGWQVYGTDISRQAVSYVQDELHYPAVCASFPNFDPEMEFGVRQFDAVTMWFVIEHFQNLDAVLRAVSKMLKTGGIFAFSTPSASGVSARYSPEKFYSQNPADHFSIWELKNTPAILERYGFRLLKTVSTGHHPERFPSSVHNPPKQKSLHHSVLNAVSTIFRLGDTFEIYCTKTKDLI